MRDLTPILHPSVIRSAMVWSDSFIASITFVFTQDILFAIGSGSLPSSPYLSRSVCSSEFSFSCSFLQSQRLFFNLSDSAYLKTSFMDSIPIFTPASHSRRSLTVSFSIIRTSKVKFIRSYAIKEIYRLRQYDYFRILCGLYSPQKRKCPQGRRDKSLQKQACAARSRGGGVLK